MVQFWSPIKQAYRTIWYENTINLPTCANVANIILLLFYKIKLPGYVLKNLDLLSDICTINYPMSDNPQRAILYRRSSVRGEDENCNRRSSSASEEELNVRTELRRSLSNHEVPTLQIPKEEYPSVLVMEATNTNTVILRWEGSQLSFY